MADDEWARTGMANGWTAGGQTDGKWTDRQIDGRRVDRQTDGDGDRQMNGQTVTERNLLFQ